MGFLAAKERKKSCTWVQGSDMGLLSLCILQELSLSLFTFMHWRTKWQPTPVFLPGASQGRGVWWAAVYGVAQSRTRLKRLSSSSSSCRDLFKKMRDTKGTFHAKMGTIRDRYGMDLTEAEYIKKRVLLLLSHFSCVRLCATPQTAAHQAPPSLGFSRQEHWSGLPFPSLMHESEKWKWSCSVMSDSSNPMDCSLPGSSVHGIFQARQAKIY